MLCFARILLAVSQKRSNLFTSWPGDFTEPLQVECIVKGDGFECSCVVRLGKRCVHLRKMQVGDESLERERKAHVGSRPAPSSHALVNDLEVIAAIWLPLHP